MPQIKKKLLSQFREKKTLFISSFILNFLYLLFAKFREQVIPETVLLSNLSGAIDIVVFARLEYYEYSRWRPELVSKGSHQGKQLSLEIIESD